MEARLLQRSWPLRSSWRPSSIFEMEVVAYDSATKLKAFEFNRRKRREHRWRHAVAERVMVAAVRMAPFFHRHVMERSSMRGRCLVEEVLQSWKGQPLVPAVWLARPRDSG